MNEQKQLRAAIIGCGLIASDHLSTIKARCGAVELHLCDRSLDAAKKLNEGFELNAVLHTDAVKLLEEETFDIVQILTPPDSHFELARLALQKGANVLVEKPMTLTREETAKLYDLAEREQKLLCVGHSLLYMDCVLKALDLIRSGRIGRVISAHCYFGHAEKGKTISYRGVSHWAYGLPGGPVLNLISHPASVLVELLGTPKEITYLSCARNCMPYGLPDMVDVRFAGEAGMGGFTISMAHGNADRQLSIQCERGSIYIDFARQLITVRKTRAKLGFVSKAFGGIGQGWSLIVGTLSVIARVATKRLKRNPGTRELVARFYQAVRENGAPPVTKENALGVAEIVDRVLIYGEVSNEEAAPSPSPVAAR